MGEIIEKFSLFLSQMTDICDTTFYLFLFYYSIVFMSYYSNENCVKTHEYLYQSCLLVKSQDKPLRNYI
ncbi:hypothetical protein BpHYR1_040487 [Brachionus plicatilis]|uniref:Uncharacterized protein n=1 Tax=Brachionus plicatilis TaxID=10195 RepID=A0A3M7Q902_BRAPC|nr:hypothetical protein BpHYR1_040487 [Brachionus plicatilis]